MGRPSKDLNPQTPIFVDTSTKPELPVKDVARRLTVEEGKPLDITTRTTPGLGDAAQFANAWVYRYGSTYAAGRVDLVKRLAISMNGEGRRDLIDALTAGGSVPGEYYTDGKKSRPVFTSDE